MRTGKAKNKGSTSSPKQPDDPLPLASLRLLSPPLRLVSAAAWKVMQQRDVLQYGKLGEFVTSISETVPGLLNYRHLAKLTVGLQARLILELLRVSEPPESELIIPQLERVQAPKLQTSKRKDQKVETAVKSFHTLVHALLEDPEERNQFFQEQFDSQYGPQYESSLEKLLWEFLTRLDELLPVPDLAQTVSWLCASPAVLEECARSVSQPQLLRTLLHHERCLGHLESSASIPSSIGDSILSSLSLPPSGRVKDTNQPGAAPTAHHNRISSATESRQETNSKQAKGPGSQIAPVIGSICSGDLPQRATEKQNTLCILDSDNEEEEAITQPSLRVGTRSYPNSKRIQNNNSDEKEQVVFTAGIGTPSSEVEDQADFSVKAMKRSKRKRTTNVTENKEIRRSTRSSNRDRNSKERPEYISETSKTTAQNIQSQKEEDLPDVLASCQKLQPKVIIPKLDIRDMNRPVLLKTEACDELESTLPNQTATEGVLKVIHSNSLSRKRKFSGTSTPKRNLTSMVDGQSCDCSPCIPLMPLRRESSEKASPVIGDMIVDSEDEATENVKGKLFTKRYCKTKNNTYIPTLHEFWTPAFLRRDLVSPGNGYR